MSDELKYQQYCEERAEARACGFEFPPYDEWLNPSLVRKRAEQRVSLWDDDYYVD